mgnify:CR=1 FL=1
MTEERKRELRRSYDSVAERIAAARRRRYEKTGVDTPVTLLGASKTMPAEDITYLMRDCGLRVVGENRAQEFAAKYDDVAAAGGEYHFIGHLQTNKVKTLIGRAALIHSVDSVHLAQEIGRQSTAAGITTRILGQVNSGCEASKSGVAPADAHAFFAEIASIPGVELCGMMIVAPILQDPEEVREKFRESYRIFIDFFTKIRHNIKDPVLSMGMSDTFEIAIEEGANLVRVGSALFGKRQTQI